MDPMEFVEEVLPQDRGVEDVRVDTEDDVLVLGEAPRDRRESDRLDEARAEQGGVQPVQVFRRILEDLHLVRCRRALDLDERIFLLRAARADRRYCQSLYSALDRSVG